MSKLSKLVRHWLRENRWAFRIYSERSRSGIRRVTRIFNPNLPV
jgi:hypothetical protein